MIVPWWRFISGRGGQSAGGGTSGRVAHWPRSVSGGWPSAPTTVRISRSPTCAITRAWLIWWPRTASTTSRSSDRGRAREREELRGRPDARPAGDAVPSPRCAAPRPQPPKSAPVPGDQGRDDREPPAVGIFGAFETEERERVHRRRRLPGTAAGRFVGNDRFVASPHRDGDFGDAPAAREVIP